MLTKENIASLLETVECSRPPMKREPQWRETFHEKTPCDSDSPEVLAMELAILGERKAGEKDNK